MAATTAGIYQLIIPCKSMVVQFFGTFELESDFYIYILFLSYGCAHMGLNVISLYLHSTKVQEKNTDDLLSFIEHTLVFDLEEINCEHKNLLRFKDTRIIMPCKSHMPNGYLFII